jgi:hypothetical protein
MSSSLIADASLGDSGMTRLVRACEFEKACRSWTHPAAAAIETYASILALTRV